jgi:tetratricopeptide (TPR) repeat protein
MVAVTQGQIADILEARGEMDEALRIRTEEELPVYQRLGDVRSVAIAQSQIADILQARGEMDKALCIRTEEQLPVLQRLGDVRAVAVTQGRIADILWAQGKTDEALALQEKRLATNRHLGDADGVAASLWSIAQIEIERDQLEQAFPRIAEAWPLIVKLGRPAGIAFVGHVFGQFLAAAGSLDEARNVLGQAAAAYRKLGQATEAAQIEAMIADINNRQS